MSSAVPGGQTLHNNKRFVFRSNLNKLLSDAKRFPPSSNPCPKCAQKKRACICNIINGGVGRRPRYEIEELRESKAMLNDLRNALNDVDLDKWSAHTKLLDSTSLVTKHISEIKINVNGKNEPGVELVTNAWLKLYEILEFYNVVESLKPNVRTEGGVLNSFHISECPGGFIAALNHNLKSKNYSAELRWFATSLNPYFEGNDPNVVLAEDILFRDTYQNWILGLDNSGDITKSSNIEYIWDHVSRPSRYKSKQPLLVDLVTADGSFNCQFDPNNQEILTSSLKFSEVVCALGLLRVGGCFILKMFTLFEECSLSILTLLALCFKKLEVYKPFLSKESNAEVYVVCLNFNGITSILLSSLCKFVDSYSKDRNGMSIFPREWVPSGFRTEFVDCARMFSEIQWRSLRNSLSLYKTTLNENPYYKEKREFATSFIRQFRIGPISPESRLVRPTPLTPTLLSGKETSSLGHLDRLHLPKFNERQAYHKLYHRIHHERTNSSSNGSSSGATSSGTGSSSSELLVLRDDEETLLKFKESVRDVARYCHKYPPVIATNSTTTTTSSSSNSGTKELVLHIKLNEGVKESLTENLRAQRYLKENWFSVGRLEPRDFSFSFFCNNDLLFQLIYLRTRCAGEVPVTSVQESLSLFSSYGEALGDLNSLPNITTTHLAFVFKRFLDVKKYKKYVEISSNPGQEFPSINLLKRYNINGALLCHSSNSSADHSTSSSATVSTGGVGDKLVIFENIFELQTILNNLPGEGNVELCFEYDYLKLLESGQSYKSLIGEILESSLKRSCDFVFCDLADARTHREIAHKELTSKAFLMAQLIQALNCLSDGGDLVLKIFTLLTRFTVGVLCALATVFEDVALFRPESVPTLSQQLFVVCKNYRDKENSLCRHLFQCVWDAMCVHQSSGQGVLQVLKPCHFATIARSLYDFNNVLLKSELDELLGKDELLGRDQKLGREFINRNQLVDVLFPQKLVETSSGFKLLKMDYEVDVGAKGVKRRRVETPVLSSESESSSPIWSDDDLDEVAVSNL